MNTFREWLLTEEDQSESHWKSVLDVPPGRDYLGCVADHISSKIPGSRVERQKHINTALVHTPPHFKERTIRISDHDEVRGHPKPHHVLIPQKFMFKRRVPNNLHKMVDNAVRAAVVGEDPTNWPPRQAHEPQQTHRGPLRPHIVQGGLCSKR